MFPENGSLSYPCKTCHGNFLKYSAPSPRQYRGKCYMCIKVCSSYIFFLLQYLAVGCYQYTYGGIFFLFFLRVPYNHQSFNIKVLSIIWLTNLQLMLHIIIYSTKLDQKLKPSRYSQKCYKHWFIPPTKIYSSTCKDAIECRPWAPPPPLTQTSSLDFKYF